MEIKVDVSQIASIDLSTVVGDRLVYDHDAEDTIPHAVTLADIVADKIVLRLVAEDGYRDQRKTVMMVREQMIREKLEPIVTKAIEGPIQKTNSFGEATGPAVTLRELIMVEVGRVINDRRNSNGYNDNKSPTVLEKLIKAEVGTAFAKEVQDTIEAEKAKITKILRDQAAIVLSKTIDDAAAILSTTTKQN